MQRRPLQTTSEFSICTRATESVTNKTGADINADLHCGPVVLQNQTHAAESGKHGRRDVPAVAQAHCAARLGAHNLKPNRLRNRQMGTSAREASLTAFGGNLPAIQL